MSTRKERSSSNGSPGTTPTPPPVSGLQTEEGTATRPRASSSETPANLGAGFDSSMMEKFFSFMSFYEQHQQGVPAQSNNSNNNNNVTPMSLDGSSYARGNQQQQPTFAPYEPQRGSPFSELMEESPKQRSAPKSTPSNKTWTCKKTDIKGRHQHRNLRFTLSDATTTTTTGRNNRSQYPRSATSARLQGILVLTARIDNAKFVLQAVNLPRNKQEFKLYHGKGSLYIGKAVLKNNVFVLDFVPDLGTADSDAIVNFADWTHPPDLDPDFSPEGFWYSHTIPKAERTRALVTIQHSTAAETTSTAAETTSAAAGTTRTATTTTPVLVDETPPTPAQQLHPAPRE
ncbi:unnamed protein product, partial [Closterium sp. NIES-54]